MKLSPITYASTLKQTTACSKNNNKQNLSFNGIGTGTALVLLKLAKDGKTALIKGKEKVKYLDALKDCVSKPGTNEFLDGIMAITKTPNAFYDYHHQGITFWLGGLSKHGDIDYVDDLRHNALIHLSSLFDSSSYVIQAKKDFLYSLIENGHEITEALFEQFSRLNDNYYKSFKEEFIDKCFFSTKYNKIRNTVDGIYGFKGRLEPTEYSAACDPFNIKGGVCDSYDMYSPNKDFVDRKGVYLQQLYYNLKLVSTLDKNVHGTYLRQKRSIIEQAKHKLEEYFARLETKDLLYKIPNLLDDYRRNIKPI